MATLEVNWVVRVFHSHSPAELELCWDEKSWLKPGDIVEISDIVLVSGDVVVKIQRDEDDGPAFVNFGELSCVNRKDVVELFPSRRHLFWLH